MSKKIRYTLWNGLACIGIGHLISILSTLIINDGSFHPVSPLAITMYGSSITAAVVQTLVCFVFGLAFSIASLIYQDENRSLLKAKLLHFSIVLPITLIGAHVAGWVRPRLSSIIFFVGIFILIYLAIWVANYKIWNGCSQKINRRIQNGRNH